jgi:hypothetical protein
MFWRYIRCRVLSSLLILSLFFPGNGNAQILPIYPITQETSRICWAASLKMVLDYYGIYYWQCNFTSWANYRDHDTCCDSGHRNKNDDICNSGMYAEYFGCLDSDDEECVNNILDHFGGEPVK